MWKVFMHRTFSFPFLHCYSAMDVYKCKCNTATNTKIIKIWVFLVDRRASVIYDLPIKGTVHQMYECCSKVLLHLGRMLGVVFMVQRGQIWPKNTKTCFDKMYRVPFRSATRSFEKCHPFLSEVPPVPFRSATCPFTCAVGSQNL